MPDLQYQADMAKHSVIWAGMLLLLCTVPIQSYIDVELAMVASSADVCLNMPITVDSQQYHIAVSLHNQQQYIVAPTALPHKKKHAQKRPKEAVMHVWSLEGYTLEGWKRFFMEVFLFEDSKYSHTITLNLDDIKIVDKKVPMTNGIMTVGPQLQDNHFYQLIKQQTGDFFKEDIVSFYMTPGNKEVRMQLGGYEDQNAQGYSNGVRFYEKPIDTSSDGKHWVLPVGRVMVAKERSNRWESYNIPHSEMSAKLSLQSQQVILPMSLKEDLQTSFESEEIECSFSPGSNQLQCANISSIDEALTFLSFSLDKEVTVNISLYDLRDQYNPNSKLTSFFIRLSSNSEDVQIGAALIKGYYISINLTKKTLLFSPLNRFAPEITTAEIIRFIAMFMGFMLGACVCIVVWQQYNAPSYRKNRFTRGKDGVRLVAYHRPPEVEPLD